MSKPTAEEIATRTKEARESIERNLRALEDLLSTDGWKVYQAHLKQQRASVYSHVLLQNDAVPLARNVGALAQLDIEMGWVEAQIQAFRMQLNQSKERSHGS